MGPKAEAHVELVMTLSTDLVRLSSLDTPFRINITARALSSSWPSSSILFNARGSALDNSQFMGGSAYYFGGIKLRSVSDLDKIIALAPTAKVSYSRDVNPDLRHNKFECFREIPAVGDGELVTNTGQGQGLMWRTRAWAANHCHNDLIG
ncbi:hypothetical protein SCUP234_12457 [Seiridium cupressi]